MSKEKKIKKSFKISSCLDCPFHKVINDPDPHDSFCSDDMAIVCTKEKNTKQDLQSRYSADRQPHRTVTVSCRPYNLKKESDIPKWCPL